MFGCVQESRYDLGIPACDSGERLGCKNTDCRQTVRVGTGQDSEKLRVAIR